MKPFRITDMIAEHADYDMIHQNTKLPPVTEGRLRLLFAALQDTEMDISTGHEELFPVAVGLLQLGMDTHDYIEAESLLQTIKDMRARQLNVLAGDYFSSKFYDMLARAGQVQMIGILSGAVCTVNEHKLDFYVRMKQQRMTEKEYIEGMIDIRSDMFIPFASILPGKLRLLWPELVRSVAAVECWLAECSKLVAPLEEDSWSYWHMRDHAAEYATGVAGGRQLSLADQLPVQQRLQLQRKLDQHLEAAIAVLERQSKSIVMDRLASELSRLCMEFREAGKMLVTAVEE